MATPTSNPAWTVPEKSSSVTQLTKKSIAVPTPGPNQVLIKLTATSLNFRDLVVVLNSPLYPRTNSPDLVPCADAAGIIHSTHPSSSWSGKEGTVVVLHPNTWLSGDVQNLNMGEMLGMGDTNGTLQSWITLNDEFVVKAPKGLSGVESSTILTAGVPAWNVFRSWVGGALNGELKEWDKTTSLKGKTVLCQGTGGVSTFAIQIASTLGATVIATSSSDDKLKLAESIGATHVINYKKTPDWDKEVLRLTDGKGVDHTIEVGGAQTLMKSLNSTRRGGLISLIGALSEMDPLPAEFVTGMLFGAKTLKAAVAYSRDATNEFARFIEERNIKPPVGKVFEFDQAVEAFQTLQKQDFFGKVVIKISDE